LLLKKCKTKQLNLVKQTKKETRLQICFQASKAKLSQPWAVKVLF